MPLVIKTTQRPSSASRDTRSWTPCSPTKDNVDNPAFYLTGYQVNLTPRPSSNAGKASVRSISLPAKKKKRPMSAVPLPSYQSYKKTGSKPRPMSADIEKYVIQRRSVERACLDQPWQTFDELTKNTLIASNEETENSNFLSQTVWRKEEQNSFKVNTLILNAVSGYESMTENVEVSKKSENSDGTNIESQTDALLDQLLESTVQQTKKQLRFAQTETDLMTLSLPCHLVTSDFSNPVEEFLGTLVEDIKDKVKDSFPISEEKSTQQNLTLNKTHENEDFENQKLLVEQLLTNNNSSHKEETTIHHRSVTKKRRQQKPKTIAELLEIIDSEIPIQFSKKPTIPIKPNFPRDSGKPVNNSHQEVSSDFSNVQREIIGPPENDLAHEEPKQEVNCEDQHPTETVQHSQEECKNLSSDIKQDQISVRDKAVEASSGAAGSHILNDILDFLDQVEKLDDLSTQRDTDIKFLNSDWDVDKEETRLGGTSGDRQVAALREALQERAAHVQLLKESLLQARLEGAEALAAASKEHRAAQRKTKAESDSALRKLQDGMDKLLSDKKRLVEKVEELLQQLKSVEAKHQVALQTLQQRHTVEVARTKQLAAAAEKIRRERWVERQTARIKELTVKGLEPELTRLSLQHENKVAQLQAVHARELQAQAEAEARRADELRALLTRDKDEELARERTLLTERFERQLSEERAMLELRCERLREEATSEASRLQAGWASQRESLLAEARQEAARTQAAHEQQLVQLEERKQAEVHAAQEALQSEQQTWLASQSRKQAEVLAATQRGLREERDAEIERAIERLEAEERRGRAEQERELDKKLARLREQQAAVVADRELAERLLQARLSDAQNAMQASEEQLLAARAAESRLKQELCISAQRVEALEADHSRVRENVSQQFEARVAELELRVEQLKAERDAELEQVHARLKGVLEKKDQLVEQLRGREAELAKRCRHLESLLGRQPLNPALL